MIARRWILAGALALAAAVPAMAQTAADRAGELKVWREQCSDPDPDLRLAYVEAALDTKDTSIIRICARQSLESDNADIRNLGLRAAIASMDRILFEVQIPKVLAEAYEDAGDDNDKLSAINNWFIARDWQTMRNGLAFDISKADVEKGTSVWSPLAGLSEASDRRNGRLTITGDRVSWVGSANLSYSECNLNATLVAGPALEGEWLCARVGPFKVSAKLL